MLKHANEMATGVTNCAQQSLYSTIKVLILYSVYLIGNPGMYPGCSLTIIAHAITLRNDVFLGATVVGAYFGLSSVECAVGESCVFNELYTTPGRNAVLSNKLY